MVAAAYAAWIEMRNEVLLTYSDKLPEPIPLSGQKEFAKIRQIVIDEAMKIVRGEIDIAPDVSDGDDTVSPDEVPDDSPEPEADIGNGVKQDKEESAFWLSRSAEQGNVHAQHCLDRMNDYDSSVLNMTARLLYRLSRIFEDNARELPNKNRSDSKARRKEKLKKIAQGHARDDREQDSTMA